MSESASVELQIKHIVADLAQTSVDAIEAARWVTDYRVDSLQLLILREKLESVLQVHFPDSVWLNFSSIREVADYVSQRRPAAAAVAAGPSGSVAVAPSGPATAPAAAQTGAPRRYTPSGLLYADIEVGMPLTGRNNLAEGPLLQLLGDLRWSHISQLCGVPSKQIVDAEQNRLYPTFFFVEMNFPPTRPLAGYGENDRVKAVSDLRRFGASMLDGTFHLLPADAPETGTLPPATSEAPTVRLSNIFVMQFSGAEWLKKSRPANPGFDRIPELAQAPDSYVSVKQAEKDGRFGAPPAGYVRMTDAPVSVEYRLVPDRDLNGAGLVYFANYPVFLDIAERSVLEAAALPLPSALIDRRTLVRRRSAYLNNASARDLLRIEVEPWLENPFLSDSVAPELAPIRLWLNFKMYRQSDGRLMMVSTAEKTVFSRAIEDAPFCAELEQMAQAR